MKNLQNILYGVIIGHWVMNVLDRLCPSQPRGRYVVVAMHSSRDEYVIVGSSSSYAVASAACDFVEEYALQYIGLLYDLTNPDDRHEFQTKIFTTFIEDEDAPVLEDAKCQFGFGR